MTDKQLLEQTEQDCPHGADSACKECYAASVQEPFDTHSLPGKAFDTHSRTPAAQPAPVQDVDWKDMYEKEKRRSEMWIAKYEKDIGPLEKAAPVAAPVQEHLKTEDTLFQQFMSEADKAGITHWPTPPAAQRQWVEVEQIKWEGDKLIAKLKEKNNG
jgi:hypothetical protein